LTIESNMEKESANFQEEEGFNSKKNQFYISQNYIRSKKTIDNASMIAKKIKKRSVNI
jgi:hypothetical protein